MGQLDDTIYEELRQLILHPPDPVIPPKKDK